MNTLGPEVGLKARILPERERFVRADRDLPRNRDLPVTYIADYQILLDNLFFYRKTVARILLKISENLLHAIEKIPHDFQRNQVFFFFSSKNK